MKSTAVFVGVNVAVSIPLVICQQAMAEGEAQLAGTADFLKSSLAKAETATARPMTAGDPTYTQSRRPMKIKRDLTASETISSPRAIAARTTLAPIDGVKLRPFVPGRKLPSKADLETGFTAMAPQFDNGSDPSNLNAGVSENAYVARPAAQDYIGGGYNDYRPVDARTANRTRLKDAARVASGYDRRSASRSLPNQQPSTPGQVGFPCAQQAVANMQVIRAAAPNAINQWPGGKPQVGDAAMAPMGEQMAAGEMAEAAPQSTAGPAPFPLNLLPEASLKQFIGSTKGPAKKMQPGAPSYFGSWKQGSNIATKPSLQPSGFHTYLGGGSGGTSGPTSHMTMSSAFHAYAPLAMSNHRAMPHPPPAATTKHAAQNVHASATVQVATYGPYVSHVTY